MMRRTLCLLLCAALLAAAWPASAADARMLTDFVYDDMKSASEGLVPAKRGGLWGYLDAEGREAIPARYQLAAPFSGGIAAVYLGGRWAFIDRSGAALCDFIYEDAHSFSDGYAAVKRGGLWGFVDAELRVAVAPRYAGAGNLSCGLAPVQGADGRWGYADMRGEVVIPLGYAEAADFSDGLALVKTLGGGFGYLDVTGRALPSLDWSGGAAYSGGSGVLYRDGGGTRAYSIYSGKSGALITDYHWQWVGKFSEGLAPVLIDGMYGYIDGSGKLVIAARWESAGAFSEGAAAVSTGGRHGYLLKDGSMLLDCRFDEAMPFAGGYAAVRSESGWGFVSRSGASLSPHSFDGVGSASGGLMPVRLGGKYALMHDGVIRSNTSAFAGASLWALPELEAAAAAGLLEPLDAGADYAAPITREAFCELVVAFYDRAGGESPEHEIKNPFRDSQNVAVVRAYGLGIVTGRDETHFMPQASITREELCVMLYRLCEALGIAPARDTAVSFSDAASISAWARDAVDALAGAGVVTGAEGKFLPRAQTSTEQAALMLYRLWTAELESAR